MGNKTNMMWYMTAPWTSLKNCKHTVKYLNNALKRFIGSCLINIIKGYHATQMISKKEADHSTANLWWNDLNNKEMLWKKTETGVTHWQRKGEVAFWSFTSTYGHTGVLQNLSQHRQKVNSQWSDNIMRQDSHSCSVKQCLKVCICFTAAYLCWLINESSF